MVLLLELLINILNNAKDALNKIENSKKLIFISIYLKNEEIFVSEKCENFLDNFENNCSKPFLYWLLNTKLPLYIALISTCTFVFLCVFSVMVFRN